MADFVTALDRLERWTGSRPAYPTEPWHPASREAESADTRRLIAARYAELDVAQHRVTYHEQLSGSALPQMNRRPLRLESVESAIAETHGRKIT